MKKKYLSIEIARNENGAIKENVTINVVTQSKFLLTGNISGWIKDGANPLRLYFLNSNPFTFTQLYMTESEFLFLVRGEIKNIVSIRQNSIFTYSVIEL